jgi:hypothetical protein
MRDETAEPKDGEWGNILRKTIKDNFSSCRCFRILGYFFLLPGNARFFFLFFIRALKMQIGWVIHKDERISDFRNTGDELGNKLIKMIRAVPYLPV